MIDSGKKVDAEVGGTAHITPLSAEQMDSVRDIIEIAQRFSGYVPTSFRIMARKPNILRAFNALITAVMREPGEVAMETKWLIAHAVSTSAGCRYCQAHTAANGAKAGIPEPKLEALMNYETSDLYMPSERVAVALALAAGQVPNSSTREHFDALRVYFSDDAIVEIVAVISLFGWLNRWNDTLASDLEVKPLAFALDHLSPMGWNSGKHVREVPPRR
jgi:uncharacterized peroxidase-related enzyme